MTEPLIPIETIKYKTHLKRALVEAIRSVFEDHPDPILAGTKIDIEFPTDEVAYPTVIIRYFERDVRNAGIGHKEWVQGALEEQPDAWTKFNHGLYHGTAELAIHALSSYDRDLVSDSLVHMVRMGDLEGWTNQFFDRIYNQTADQDPVSPYHYINLNTDTMTGIPESQVIAPWQPEDVLVYQTGYRLDVFGEITSLPPEEPYGVVERVDVYPYIQDIEPRPEGANDTGVWIQDEGL